MFAASVSVERVGEAIRQRGPALLLGWHAHTWHVAGMACPHMACCWDARAPVLVEHQHSVPLTMPPNASRAKGRGIKDCINHFDQLCIPHSSLPILGFAHRGIHPVVRLIPRLVVVCVCKIG
jgi:hypothetical protein